MPDYMDYPRCPHCDEDYEGEGPDSEGIPVQCKCDECGKGFTLSARDVLLYTAEPLPNGEGG